MFRRSVSLPMLLVLLFLAGRGVADDVRPEDKGPKREDYRYAGKSFDQWVASMQTELEVSRRLDALKAMKAFGVRGYDKEAPVAIVRLVRDHLREHKIDDAEGEKVLNAAMDTLALMPAASEPLLVDGLKNADEVYRQFCRDALCYRIELSPASVPALVDTILSDDSGTAESATTVMSYHFNAKKKQFRHAFDQEMAREGRQAAFVKALAKRVESEICAVYVLEHMGPAALPAVPALLEALGKEKRKGLPYSLSVAVRALRKIGGDADKITPVMVSLLETGNGAAEAVELLGDLGPKARSAVPALVKYMNSGKHDNRVAALKALEKIEEPRLLVPQLVAEFGKNGFASTWYCEFELACVAYFGNQGAQAREAMPLLVQEMRKRAGSSISRGTEGYYLQQPYVEALGRIGPAAQEALPALRGIAANSSVADSLKTAATEAIKLIAPEK